MKDAAVFRKKLLALQAELQQRLEQTQSEERHEVEGGDDTTAQLWQASEVRDGLNDEAVSELGEISRALARLEAGDYGICTTCGEPIDPKRLKVLPYAEHCVACAA